MDMNKGISPLIAAVVLIAFVVAVAGIASTFFTDITLEWSEQARGGAPVECALMRIDVLSVANQTDNVSVVYMSAGSDIYDGVSATFYDGDNDVIANEINDTSLDAGEIGTVIFEDVSLEVGGRVEVTSRDCPGVSDAYSIEEEDL